MTQFRPLARATLSVMALVACVCLLGTPATAANYQVTASFASGGNSPDPTILTFDYSGALSYAGTVTPNSVTFDSACGTKCSIIFVTWNTALGLGGLDVEFLDAGKLYNAAISLPFGVSTTGTYSGLLGGNVTVTDPPGNGVPEASSYLELLVAAVGLASWGFRRHSIKLTA